MLFTALPAYRPTALTGQCPDGSPPPCASRAAHTLAASPTSVAVLYFDNLSRDTSDAYIADGLTEELITRLGQIDRLQVKSRTAVQRYRGRPLDDPAALGRALGVAELVSGSVRRGNGRVRVTVEMTRASTGVHVWGDTYERPGDDLMAVETDIAQAIAAGVGGRLAPSEQRVLAARPTVNPEAYDHYLRGNYLIAQRTPANARRALAEYETAVQLDPRFAKAYARIGIVYSLFADWGWPWPGLPRDSILERGWSAVGTALRIDSLTSEAWTARGTLSQFRYPTDFDSSADAFRRAVALEPRSAEAWHHYGVFLSYARQDSAAVAAYRRSLALEPERVITLSDLGWALYLERHVEEATVLTDSALALDPQADYVHAIRAEIALARADTAHFRASVAAALRTRRPDYLLTTEHMVIALDVMNGDTTSARNRIAALISQFPDREHPTVAEGFAAALGLVFVGDREGALAMLERVRPSLSLAAYMGDPLFDPIRSDPRFARVFARSSRRP